MLFHILQTTFLVNRGEDRKSLCFNYQNGCDFGMKPLDNNQRLMLLEIFEDRHGKKSTVITSQLPVNKWHEIIGEPTIADAILDRLVHSSFRIELKGESMRKMYKNNE